MKGPEISVCIVSYNAPALLKNCLVSIYQNTSQDFEIIIVDNSSSDATVKMVRQEFPQVRLVKNKENLGFAKANNQAIKIAHGKYVMLLNQDTILLGDAFRIMKDFIEKENADVVAPRLFYPDREIQNSVIALPTLKKIALQTLSQIFCVNYHNLIRNKLGKSITHLFGKEARIFLSNFENISLPIRIPSWCYVRCAAIMAKREIFEEYLFDERYFFYGEDKDFFYALGTRNKKVFLTPAAEIVHIGGWRRGNWGLSKVYFESERIFFRKHFQGIKLFILLLLSKIRERLAKLKSEPKKEEG